MSKFKITCTCVGLFLVSNGNSDLLYGGSFYSSKGIGLVSDFVSGRSVGMGGIGLAVMDPFTINYLNPATLSAVTLTTLSGTFNHESVGLKSTGQSATISDSNFDGFQFVIPIQRNTAVIAIGANPYSTIEFSFAQTDSIGGTIVDQEIDGDGGVNTAFFSLSIRPFSKLSLGVTGLFYFGKLRTLHRAIFVDPLSRNTQTEVSQNVTAGGFRFGLVFNIVQDWNIAAIFAPRLDLKTDKVVTLQQVAQFSDFDDQDFNLPSTIAFGTSIRAFNKFSFGFDYLRQNWSNVTSNSYVNNSQRFGVGVEYFPSGSRLDSYFSKVSYRAGFSFKDTGIEDPVNQRITEFFGTVGVGLPVKWSAARIDLGLQAGRRGSISKNPFRETIVRFTATISVAERWFFRGSK